MSDKFDVLANKLDNVAEKVSDIGSKLEVHVVKFEAHIEREDERNSTLMRHADALQENTESLKDHMRRTDALETFVKKIDERLTPVELEAIHRKAIADWWKTRIWFAAKLGGALGALGALAGMLKFVLNSL